jgi:hypothetical protein
MIVNNHIEQEDLALYVMHLLTESEAGAIESHLGVCEGCADAAALLRGDLAALAMTTELHSPPASARHRLTTQVAREKKIVAMDRAVHKGAGSPLENRLSITDAGLPRPRPVSGALPWVSWVGWAVAAGLTVSVVDIYRERDELQFAVTRQASEMARLSADAERGRTLISTLTDGDAMRVTLSQTAAKPVAQGRATYVPAKGSLLFIASNLAPLQPYKTYELWLLPADGQDPIPAGTFQPDARGNASVILPDIPKGVVAKGFGVTIEDEGGSRQPTPPIVLSGS